MTRNRRHPFGVIFNEMSAVGDEFAAMLELVVGVGPAGHAAVPAERVARRQRGVCGSRPTRCGSRDARRNGHRRRPACDQGELSGPCSGGRHYLAPPRAHYR